MRTRYHAITLLALAATVAAQRPDGADVRPTATDPRVMLDYAAFDPTVSVPSVPNRLAADADINLHIVQFHSTPTDADRDAVRRAGGVIKGYLPHDCHIVYLRGGGAALYAVEGVRWVGPYEPTYRLEPQLRKELATGQPPTRRYNLVMADKRADKRALAAKIAAIGGEVVNRHDGGLLFTAALTGEQLALAARLDEVLWIDRCTPTGLDMDKARVQGGADHVEAVAGYTGQGVVGHVYEGVEGTHPDFTTPMVQVGPVGCSGDDRHGHCTAGIVFGNGASAAQARGMAPDAVGFFTNYLDSANTTCATSTSRNTILSNAIANNGVMFTTASWGNTQTTNYTSVSADADDIVFDTRIPWTQSQSNLGSQLSRPQAWAKNVISVGGVFHSDNSDPSDDSWAWPGPGPLPFSNVASIGPAQDGRNKPDLVAYYDSVMTSDLSGAAGYNILTGTLGNFTAAFGGTSAATPIVAGHNALAIQMYTDHIFDNVPVVAGGSRFQNRPMAQTLKALQIACADMYTPTFSNNRREHVGWGFPSVRTMYDNRDKISIVPEDVPISQGQTRVFRYDVAPGESILKCVMTYLDPAGNPAAAFDRVNDLTMTVIAPSGATYLGNFGLDGFLQTNQSVDNAFANPDTRDTVECVVRNNPEPGLWSVVITAPTLTTDAHVATTATDATFALVVNGARRAYGSGCARFVPNASPTAGVGNYFPWGGYTPSALTTTFASNNGGGTGGTVYFDVTVTEPTWLHGISLNSGATLGQDLFCDLYWTGPGGTHVGVEQDATAWTPVSAGRGVAAGVNNPSSIDLAQPVMLQAGTYGFAVHANNFAHRYTTGANTVSTNSGAVTVDAGAASNGLFGGGLFQPRTANVELRFRKDSALAQNMRYQTVLRSDELGGPGTVTGLAFAGQSDGRHFSDRVKVRLAHRPAGWTLANVFDQNISGGTTCLDTNQHWFDYRDGEWTNLGLQSSFVYDGVSDVVVEIETRGNVQTTYGTGAGPFEMDVTRERVAASFTGAPPSTGSLIVFGALRMRVEFGCANANEHGAGCGTLAMRHAGSSAFGQSFDFIVDGAPANDLAFLRLGEDVGAPFPLSLTFVGHTNCTLYGAELVTLPVGTDAAGTANLSLNVPYNAALRGFRLYGQWLSVDYSEPGNYTFSGMTRMIVGGNI